MKILQIIPYFYPAWAYGGTPRVVFELCRELVKQGHEVTVFTTDTFDKDQRINKKHFQIASLSNALSGSSLQNKTFTSANSAFYYDAEIDGIKVRYFRNLSNRLAFTQKLFLTPVFTFMIKDTLKNFEIVHLQEYRTLQNISAWKACKKTGIPYVLSAHGAILPIMGRERRKGIFDRLWGNQILRDARKLIALTELEKSQYLKFGIPEEKIQVIPAGIDLNQFASLPEKGSFRNRYGLDNEPVILFLGRIHRIKGLDLLIDAFVEIKREITNCRLVIAGPDDGFKKACRMQIDDYRLRQLDLEEVKELKSETMQKTDVIFTGLVNGNEKLSLLVDADVTVLPSRYDNFPSVPFESLMCGTPVVLSEICGVASMLKEAGAAYIARKETKRDLLEKIKEVLEDQKNAKISVEKGRKLIKERFTFDIVSKNCIQVYRSCLS